MLLSGGAHAQAFFEAHEVNQVLRTYVSSPDQIQSVDAQAALLSEDGHTYKLLLGGCLFDLVEDPADTTLSGIRVSASSGDVEVTFVARVQSGQRVDILKRQPLTCENRGYRAAVVSHVWSHRDQSDRVTVKVVELGAKSAKLFREYGSKPVEELFPEEVQLLFNDLPSIMEGETNLLFILEMTDKSKAGSEGDQQSEEVMAALIDAGIEVAVKILLGIM